MFAKWITEALGGPGPFGFNLNRQRGRSKTSMGYLGLISRAACVRCNNEWMSGFEQTARPLLAPVLRGVPTSWETPARSDDDRAVGFQNGTRRESFPAPGDVDSTRCGVPIPLRES